MGITWYIFLDDLGIFFRVVWVSIIFGGGTPKMDGFISWENPEMNMDDN